MGLRDFAIVVGVGVIVYYIYNINKNGVTPMKYNCNVSTRICEGPFTIGQYNTKAECEAACVVTSTKYNCNVSTHLCEESLTGTYNSLAECEIACKPQTNLLFSDEFGGTSIDTSKWRIKNNYTPSQGSVCMLAENAYVQNGNLIIKSRNTGGGPCGKPYSSGWVDTATKFSFKYGYMEMRCKMSRGKGMWVTFWTWGAVSPTDASEVDMFEMLGHQPNKLYFNVHTPGCNDPNCGGYSCCSSGTYTGPDFSADFHTIGVDWQQGYVAWYVDGIERFRTTKSVPQKPMYLIISTGVGGSWPGEPDGTTQFPQYYYIDYVRVYPTKP